jgi:alcohol dehydrogenase, propanol-preferring
MAIFMTLNSIGGELEVTERPIPQPRDGQVLLRVRACGVCRTDLHIVDGELPNTRVPIVPGHEIVGEVLQCGGGVRLEKGMRVGVPWLGYTCGHCAYCAADAENLCDSARFTGYDMDGGYAEYVVAEANYCFPLPAALDDLQAAPLLCAGLIGYRSLRLAGEGKRIGLYGFGAAAHLIAQVAVWQGREVYAFTRPKDAAARALALQLGARWAGSSDEPPPVQLDAAILFAPVGALVPQALQAVRKGGVVVCGGIHMSDIPAFPYSWLWGERVIRSVANLTRRDAAEFLELVPKANVTAHVEPFPLTDANIALARLRAGQISGAAVLVPGMLR